MGSTNYIADDIKSLRDQLAAGVARFTYAAQGYGDIGLRVRQPEGGYKMSADEKKVCAVYQAQIAVQLQHHIETYVLAPLDRYLLQDEGMTASDLADLVHNMGLFTSDMLASRIADEHANYLENENNLAAQRDLKPWTLLDKPNEFNLKQVTDGLDSVREAMMGLLNKYQGYLDLDKKRTLESLQRCIDEYEVADGYVDAETKKRKCEPNKRVAHFGSLIGFFNRQDMASRDPVAVRQGEAAFIKIMDYADAVKTGKDYTTGMSLRFRGKSMQAVLTESFVPVKQLRPLPNPFAHSNRSPAPSTASSTQPLTFSYSSLQQGSASNTSNPVYQSAANSYSVDMRNMYAGSTPGRMAAAGRQNPQFVDQDAAADQSGTSNGLPPLSNGGRYRMV